MVVDLATGTLTGDIRDFLLDRGATADVSDTSAPWSQLSPLYDAAIASVKKAYAELGVPSERVPVARASSR